jgi:hypothetical protein
MIRVCCLTSVSNRRTDVLWCQRCANAMLLLAFAMISMQVPYWTDVRQLYMQRVGHRLGSNGFAYPTQQGSKFKHDGGS